MARQQAEIAEQQKTAARNPVAWFEIPVRDMKRARAFYEKLLGVRLDEHRHGSLEMAFFPMERRGVGAAGSLVAGEGYEPALEGTTVYFSVEDIAAALDRAAHAGGEVLQPKTDIGEYGFIAMVRDTEGNRIALHCMK